MPENNEALARAVRSWIQDTGLTQAKISAAGGPSSTTMTKILSGEGQFRAAVFGQLDRALDWGEGRASEVWRGQTSAVAVDWRSATDDQLLGELERRLARSRGEGDDHGEDHQKMSSAADGSTGGTDSAAPPVRKGRTVGRGPKVARATTTKEGHS